MINQLLQATACKIVTSSTSIVAKLTTLAGQSKKNTAASNLITDSVHFEEEEGKHEGCSGTSVDGTSLDDVLDVITSLPDTTEVNSASLSSLEVTSGLPASLEEIVVPPVLNANVASSNSETVTSSSGPLPC